LPSLNSGALQSLIRPRWISLVAIQFVMLWSIPKTGVDLPQSHPAVISLSLETSPAFTRSAVDIHSIQEKSHGSDKVQSNPGADQGALRQACQGGASDPESQGSASDSTETCKVETSRGLALAGIHPKAGGTGQELCSGDMPLEALIACASVSMRAAAAVLEIPIRSAVVSAEGDVDLRGAPSFLDRSLPCK
jgi:hypothetical protein